MSDSAQSTEWIRKIGADLPTRDALLVALQEQHNHINALEAEKDQAVDVIDKKSEVIASQQKRIEQLEEYLRLTQRNRFGASSEKNVLQGELFNEAELLADGQGDESDQLEDNTEQTNPKKKGGGRKGLSATLPRIQLYHHLSDEQKAGAIDTFFEKTKEELDIVPAKVRVIEHMQEKAVFADAEGNRTLVTADKTPHPLGKAIASVSLLVYIIISKYADGLPLYRLEGILKRYGGDITRTTMANWLIRLSIELQPVVNLLEEHLLASPYIQGDETTTQVLKEPGMSPTGNKYMWIMRGGPPGRSCVIFNYDKSRAGSVVDRLLAGAECVYFQSDGYAGYDAVCTAKGIIHLGCWDHVRRKFVEALNAAPKSNKKAKSKNKNPSKAQVAIAKIGALYAIERKMEELGLDDDERKAYRIKHSLPKLNQLHEWLIENEPKLDKDSKTYKAISYALNQWPKMVRYCEHGSLRISNILAENAIRPFAVGRKAWLFADTPAGARASAIYYSLIETAKANGIEPYEYLKFLIENIATADTVEAYEALMPWNMK
ncbi:MAG: IS66 family transposase [Granulosicoccus sp.]